MSQTQNNPKSVNVNQKSDELISVRPQIDILLKALGNNASLLLSFEECVTVLKKIFPNSEIIIGISDVVDEPPIIISVYPEGSAPDALEKFGEFKKIWWEDKFDEIRDSISINLEHPDFVTSGNPWKAFTDLVDSVEGPEDWAMEHDHYLYGTPKKYNK